MALVHLTITMKLSKSTSYVLDMCLPVQVTRRLSHWVGVPTVTLNACTAERKKVMYVNKGRGDNFRMLEE